MTLLSIRANYVCEEKILKKYQISDSRVMLITRESCNSYGWFR